MNDNERGLTFTERLALLSKLGKAGGGNADWNANEGEAGYIKNRPFYQEHDIVRTQVLDETQVVSWDLTRSPELINNCFSYQFGLQLTQEQVDYIRAHAGDPFNAISVVIDGVTCELPINAYTQNPNRSLYGAPVAESGLCDWSNYEIAVSFDYRDAYILSSWWLDVLTKTPIHSFANLSIGEITIEQSINAAVEGFAYQMAPLCYEATSALEDKYGNDRTNWPESLTLVLNGSEIPLTQSQWNYIYESEDGYILDASRGSTVDLTIPYLYHYPGMSALKDGDEVLVGAVPIMMGGTYKDYFGGSRYYALSDFSPLVTSLPSDYDSWPDEMTVKIDGVEYTLPKNDFSGKLAFYGLRGIYDDGDGDIEMPVYDESIPAAILFELDSDNDRIIATFLSSININIHQVEIYSEVDNGEVHKIDPIFLPSTGSFETVTFTGVYDETAGNYSWTCDKTFNELCEASSYEEDIAIVIVHDVHEGADWSARYLAEIRKAREDEDESDINYINIIKTNGTYWKVFPDGTIETNW